MGAFVCESVRLSQVGNSHGLIHVDCIMATIITELSWSSIRCVVILFFGWGWVGHLLWVVYTAQCIMLENVALLEWSVIVVVSFHCELKGSSPTAVKDTLCLLFIHLWVSLDVMCQPSWSQMGKYDCHCLSYSQMSLLVLITDGSTWRQRMYKRTKPSWKI